MCCSERAAVAVDDALGHARGPGGIHDEEWVVEGDVGERERGWRRGAEERVPHDGVGQVVQVRRVVQIGDDDRAPQVRQGRDQLTDAEERLARLAGVGIAVRRNEHRGCDLAETVEHALDAEVGRARGPGGAEAGGSEHGDDGLGDVRQETGHAVALLHAGGTECGRATGDGVAQLVPGDVAGAAILGDLDEGVLRAGEAQQVAGVVERGTGEPARAEHALTGTCGLRGACELDVGKVAEGGPERVRVLDRPIPEGIPLWGKAVRGGLLLQKGVHVRLLGTGGRGFP
jgi:hypothetical protein